MRLRSGAPARSARVALCALFAAGVLSACGGTAPATDATTSSTAASYRVLVDAGLHLLGRHDVNGAEQLLFQAIRRDPHLPVAYYDLGVVFQSQGLDPAALLQFMHADSVAPDYVPALYDEAVIEAGTHPPYAMSLYRRIIAIRPDSPTALLNLGLLEHAAHDDAAALGHLRMAVQLEPALAKRLPTALRTEVGK